jgi:lipid A 3-O-deacylase
VGAGATATDIRNGDLSTTFEFNLQAGVGTAFFLQKDLAATFQYRFIHLSNAGIQFPNLGVNNSTFLLRLSWFF